MSIVSENDQKLVNEYQSMIQATMKENATHPKTPEQELKDYRAMMLKVNPYKYPAGYKSKPVARFTPKHELRPGYTAAISIPNGKGPFPILMHVHGHGLRAGSPPEYEPWIREMSSHGFVVIFPDYRWQPEVGYEDQVADMMFAIKWAKDNAAQIKGDAERMVLGGDSLGGLLALDILLRTLDDPNGPRFKAYASVDGIMTPPGPPKPEAVTNITRMKAELPIPPLVMVVGSDDFAASSALQVASKLNELKKSYELNVFYGMPHDFAKFPQLDVMHEANARLMNFLNRAVGPSA